MSASDRTAALRARRRQPATGPQATIRPTEADISADLIPHPETAAASGTLDPTEQHQLSLCEQAVDNLATASWIAGKALQSIRDRRLYRTTHERFEDYLQERWEISKRAGYQLIEEWPLAERLDRHLGRPATPSHVRALLPIARHSPDTAVALYQQLHTRTKAAHHRLTAHLIQRVVRAVLTTAGETTDQAQLTRTAHDIVSTQPLPLTASNPSVQNSAHRPAIETAAASAEDSPPAGLIGLLQDILTRTITLERDLTNAASATHTPDAHTAGARQLRRKILLRLTAATQTLRTSDALPRDQRP